MNKFGLVTGALASVLLCATSAFGADLPRKAPLYSPVSAAGWTGLYVGGHFGYVQSRTTLTDPTLPVSSNTDTQKGFLAGGQIGYNYQAGAWVFGVEADLSGSNADGGTTAVSPATGDVDSANTKIRWTSLVTGRVGYAFDRTLIYAKGGAAFGGFTLDTRDFTAGTSTSTKLSRAGWTVGAGIEYALAGPWSVRGEYDFVSFASKNLTVVNNLGATASIGFKTNVHQFKTGLNYRFGAL